jgi:CRP/FNR family transcriptional regulator, cyclic AMP receptor protein
MTLVTRPRAPIDKVTVLSKHPMFSALPLSVLERLCSHATTRTVQEGSVLFAKGDPGSSLFAVLSGTLKISVVSADGREAIFNLVHAGEIFGEIALLDGRPRTADAVAMSDCQLMEIDRRYFIPIIEQPGVALKLIDVLCTRLRWGSEHIEELMFLDLQGRLAKTLLRLTENHDDAKGERALAMTQSEVSHFVGMSREAVNKQLRDWEGRRWVRLKRNGIVVLDVKALSGLAAADFEPDLS